MFYTTYGFKKLHEKYVAPCGMNDLLYMGQKPQTKRDYTATLEVARKRGYVVVVSFTDDKETRLTLIGAAQCDAPKSELQGYPAKPESFGTTPDDLHG